MVWRVFIANQDTEQSEYGYDLNGSTMAVEFGRRLIPDPTTDQFRLSFDLITPVDTSGAVFSQSLDPSSSNREFQVQTAANGFTFIVGGSSTFVNVGNNDAGSYDIDFFASTYDVLFNGSSIKTDTLNRGSNTESTAFSVAGARHNGSNSSYAFHYSGVIRNIRVSPINPSSFDESLFRLDDFTANPRDSFGGASAEIINYNPANWVDIS